jgi:pimeloyl-ACP methyl ester carboxylesterase
MARLAAVVSGLVIAVCASSAQNTSNGFNGLEVSLATYLPSIAPANVLGSGTATVVPGVVTFANLADPPYAHTSLPSGVRLVNQNFYVDGLVITERFDVSEEGTAFFSGVPFAGEVLSILTPNAPAITGVSVLPTTNALGFTSANVSFTSTTVAINHSGASLPTNAPGVIQVAVTFGHPVAVTLVDPVPDLVHALSTAYTTLLGDPSHGRVVQGVAADGVARVVVRIPASTEGENITVSVINDTGNPSQSVDDDGGVASLDNPTSFGQSASAQAASVNGAPMAFAIYRAPIDFPRESGQDSQAAQRFVTLQVSSSVSDQPVPVIIIRPPVVLIHGLWGDRHTWDDFQPLMADPLGRFTVSTADYDGSVDPELVSDLNPPYTDPSVVENLEENALGFQYNARMILRDLVLAADTLEDTQNVAAIQADVIAHSMGGDIARAVFTLPQALSNEGTFGKGWIHKLITFDTPHLGSPLAIDLLMTGSTCTRNVLALHADSPSILSLMVGPRFFYGGVGDLRGDGNGNDLSVSLQALQRISGVPIAYIAGSTTAANLTSLDCTACVMPKLLTEIACRQDFLAMHLNASAWNDLFGQSNDAIVPEFSETNGGFYSIPISGVIHSLRTEALGFSPPSVLDQQVGAATLAISLLNVPLNKLPFTQ